MYSVNYNVQPCIAVIITQKQGRQRTCTENNLVLLRSPKSAGYFLRRGGTIKCRVSTDRHRRSPLEQGRLKVAEAIEEAQKDCIYAHTLTIIILFALVF